MRLSLTPRASTRQLGLEEARDLIAALGFGTTKPADAQTPSDHKIGVELESFVVPARRPDELPKVTLTAGSRLTFEPGGQVELSSPPETTVGAACDSLSRDLATLGEAFSPLGLDLVQCGLLARPPLRLVDDSRYQAMEDYFATQWPAEGRAMMCTTASVQVNLGFGGPDHAAARWRAANVLGPVLAASFSSAPGTGGSPRLANWLRLDPSRTAPVPLGDDPGRAWADYALDANVMLMRTDGGCRAMVDRPFTARHWVEHGHPLGWPGGEDLAYHLTTLFPPVRPRGWLELRMIDALPDPWWRVPVAAAAVLVGDDEAVGAAEASSGRWWQAARHGLADPVIGAAAVVCARRTLAGLARVGADDGTAVLAEQWAAAVCKGGEMPWT
jgi:glutamate--cysteine ligase